MEDQKGDWKEVETDVWKPENPEDMIEGVLVAKTPREGDLSERYKVETKEGIKLVWGSAILSDRLETVPVGTEVRITFKERKQLPKNKTLKIFKVETKEVIGSVTGGQ